MEKVDFEHQDGYPCGNKDGNNYYAKDLQKPKPFFGRLCSNAMVVFLHVHVSISPTLSLIPIGLKLQVNMCLLANIIIADILMVSVASTLAKSAQSEQAETNTKGSSMIQFYLKYKSGKTL